MKSCFTKWQQLVYTIIDWIYLAHFFTFIYKKLLCLDWFCKFLVFLQECVTYSLQCYIKLQARSFWKICWSFYIPRKRVCVDLAMHGSNLSVSLLRFSELRKNIVTIKVNLHWRRNFDHSFLYLVSCASSHAPLVQIISALHCLYS